MKISVKLIIQYLAFGISWGCTFFVLVSMIIFLTEGETAMSYLVDDFPRQAGGSVLAGIAFGTTSIIYRFERLSKRGQVLIHFAVGMGVFYPVSILLGWFSLERITHIILQLVISIAGFIVIWFCFYLFYRNEAKQINARLRELEKSLPEE
ncbi:MAG: DUF3021 domain-containing protein [Lachnospiraceae bacterium]